MPARREAHSSGNARSPLFRAVQIGTLKSERIELRAGLREKSWSVSFCVTETMWIEHNRKREKASNGINELGRPLYTPFWHTCEPSLN